MTMVYRRTTVLDRAQPPIQGKAVVKGQRCGSCIRWRRVNKPGSRFGACHAPEAGPKPYWRDKHPDGMIVVADCHGESCAAYKVKKLR